MKTSAAQHVRPHPYLRRTGRSRAPRSAVIGAIRERAWFALRELTAASPRFDDFVRELARFNEIFGEFRD